MADPATFADLAMQHRASLYAAAVRRTHDRDDAEDLVQETLLRGFRGFAGFEDGTNVRAWLHRILANASISSYRARQRRPAVTAFDERLAQPLAPGAAASGPSAEEQHLDRTIDPQLVQALRSLPRTCRAAVVLADLQGLSYKEIAARLEIPIGTVMSRLHRGRRHVRAQVLGVPDP